MRRLRTVTASHCECHGDPVAVGSLSLVPFEGDRPETPHPPEGDFTTFGEIATSGHRPDTSSGQSGRRAGAAPGRPRPRPGGWVGWLAAVSRAVPAPWPGVPGRLFSSCGESFHLGETFQFYSLKSLPGTEKLPQDSGKLSPAPGRAPEPSPVTALAGTSPGTSRTTCHWRLTLTQQPEPPISHLSLQ